MGGGLATYSRRVRKYNSQGAQPSMMLESTSHKF